MIAVIAWLLDERNLRNAITTIPAWATVRKNQSDSLQHSNREFAYVPKPWNTSWIIKYAPRNSSRKHPKAAWNFIYLYFTTAFCHIQILYGVAWLTWQYTWRVIVFSFKDSNSAGNYKRLTRRERRQVKRKFSRRIWENILNPGDGFNFVQYCRYDRYLPQA